MNDLAAAALDDALAQELSERLADVFRTGVAGDVLTDDVFLDGHPPFWRFQLQGREAFAGWLAGYLAEGGSEVAVVRTVPTVTGFVTELTGTHVADGAVLTDRKLILAQVRDRRIAELAVFCSGDWDAALRERHATEASMIRPDRGSVEG
jgi:hypothetical protein